jgi:hypothetical protein
MFFTSSSGEILSIPDPTEENLTYKSTRRKFKATAEHLEAMAPAWVEERGFDIAVKEVSVTEQRRPYIPETRDEELRHPGMHYFQLIGNPEINSKPYFQELHEQM